MNTVQTLSDDSLQADVCTEFLTTSIKNKVPDDGAILECVKSARLMIVDDEPINIKTVEKHLSGIGYQNFLTTTDSSEAFALIGEHLPDLVLLDIMMPEVNGLDLLRQIRADVRWRNLPVIILTAYCDPATKREALQRGATDFLAKPVDPHELALRVRNVLVAKAYYDYAAMRAEQLEMEVGRQTKELVDARHQAELRYVAGKAEIATDVLHNVGNALHSVNTGVNLVAYTIRESQLTSLKRAIELLKEHCEDLPRFLTKDERGKILPSYLIELTDELCKEQTKVSGEIAMVGKHLEHINAVVSTQQKYAKHCTVNEPVSLNELMHDVEELVGGAFARHGVEVVRDYQDTPHVTTDRQKLLQVLLNLVRNAMDSIKQAHKSGLGRLEMCIRSTDETALIEIADNGVGIPEENLIKIFTHGFTTKEDGHGFGLHSCANIIKELEGSLDVHSDGPGKGAKFVVVLPFTIEENQP